MNRFIVLSGEILVSDPCYGRTSDHMHRIVAAENGVWEASVTHTSCGRIESIEAKHTNFDSYKISKTKSVIDLGVDSGQMSIFDKEYFMDHIDEREFGKSGDFYNNCCEMTLTDDPWGIIGVSGVVTSSGFGDGCYLGFLSLTEEGKAVQLIISFVEDEADEEGYDEDEYESTYDA